MSDVSLNAKEVGMLSGYDGGEIRKLRMPLCANCRAWLEQVIGGNAKCFYE